MRIMSNQDFPIGFKMELAQNTDVLNRFSQLSEVEQMTLADKAREMKSQDEMRNYVKNMI